MFALSLFLQDMTEEELRKMFEERKKQWEQGWPRRGIWGRNGPSRTRPAIPSTGQAEEGAKIRRNFEDEENLDEDVYDEAAIAARSFDPGSRLLSVNEGSDYVIYFTENNYHYATFVY